MNDNSLYFRSPGFLDWFNINLIFSFFAFKSGPSWFVSTFQFIQGIKLFTKQSLSEVLYMKTKISFSKVFIECTYSQLPLLRTP